MTTTELVRFIKAHDLGDGAGFKGLTADGKLIVASWTLEGESSELVEEIIPAKRSAVEAWLGY